jgi:hypothetical protein
VGGGMLPLAGREMNGQIQGTWRTANGLDIPFAASVGPNGLVLQTNGVTYSLDRGGSSGTPSPANLPARGQFAPSAQPSPVAANIPAAAPAVQLGTRQGRVMQADIPAGWSFSDTTNGIDTSAPDGISYVSHTWLRGVGRCNPDMYLNRSMQMWPQWGMTDVKLISAKDVSGQSRVYEMEYNFHGRPAHAKVQVTVSPAPESYMAEMVIIQTAPENFEQYQPTLIAMAKSVRVMDANAFCDNGKINGEIRKRYEIRTQTAQEVAAIQNAGYEYRNHVQEQMFLQDSDTRRDQTRFDGSGGNQYTAPLQAQRAFRHADGTVTYSTNNYDPVPSDATELTPHAYR